MMARIRRKFQSLRPEMDERSRRQWAAAEAWDLGWGGVTLVSQATGLSRPTITADGGGSNGSRSGLWKVLLQELADELGLRLFVCHFPPGTNKWNKIEHRLFSFITQN